MLLFFTLRRRILIDTTSGPWKEVPLISYGVFPTFRLSPPRVMASFS